MPECESCGNHVSESFARVFGNQDNRIERCISCGGVQLSARDAAYGVFVIALTGLSFGTMETPAYWGVVIVAGLILMSNRLRLWWLA